MGRSMDDSERTLRRAAELGLAFLDGLAERHVGPRADGKTIAAALGGPLPEESEDPVAVIEDMAQRLDPGLVATAGPRYFGFVIGGALPAAMGADWLTAAWDQNANLHALSPAAAGAEQVAAGWMLELLGLPPTASVGLPTGAGLANAVGLAAGRHAVLAREGWDVEARGLYGAPEITVLIGEEAHATVLTALQYLGLGRERVVKVPADEQGRMRADALPTSSRTSRPGPPCHAGGQREYRRVRSDARDRGCGGDCRMPGSTLTGHSDCGLRRRHGCGIWWTASSVRTPGRRTPTSGSTWATTADSSRFATPTRTAGRCPRSPRT